MTLAQGDQQNHSIARPDTSIVVVVWEDYRYGNADIYAQKIDTINGIAQWFPIDGVPVCTADGNQKNPRAAYDQTDGVIVTWEDERNGVASVYALRIVISTGQVDPRWTANGNVICDANMTGGMATRPRIAGTKSGAYISWTDYRSNQDIYAEFVLENGTMGWSVVNGTPIATGPSIQRNAEITIDNRYSTPSFIPGVILVWEESDLATGEFDLYAGYFNSTGNAVWNARPVCTANGDQINPRIVHTGGTLGAVQYGSIITWQDRRNTVDYDVYVTLIDDAGIQQWMPNGVLVSAATSDQRLPRVALTETMQPTYAVIAWEDLRNYSQTNVDIFASLLDVTTGAVVVFTSWQIDGRPITTAVNEQHNFDIDSYSNKTIIVWKDKRDTSNPNIFLQEIEMSGSWDFVWPIDGHPATRAEGHQMKPEVSRNVMVWDDARRIDQNIYAQKVGNACDEGTYMAWRNMYAKWTSSSIPTHFRTATDPLGNVYVVWLEVRPQSGFMTPSVYIQKLDSSGVPQWLNDGILVSSPSWAAQEPNVCFGRDLSGQGYDDHVMVCWIDYRDGYSNVMVQEMNPDGSFGAMEPPIACDNDVIYDPVITSDDEGGGLVAWIDHKSGWQDKVIVLKVNSHLPAWGFRKDFQNNMGTDSPLKISKDYQNGCWFACKSNDGIFLGHANKIPGTYNKDQTVVLDIDATYPLDVFRFGGFDLSTDAFRNIGSGYYNAMVTWSSQLGANHNYDIYLFTFYPDYAAPGQFPKPVKNLTDRSILARITDNTIASGLSSFNPVLIPSGYGIANKLGEAVVAWETTDAAALQRRKIQLQREQIVDLGPPSYKYAWSPYWQQAIDVSVGNWNSRYPQIAWVGNDLSMVAWEDDRIDEVCTFVPPHVFGQLIDFNQTNPTWAQLWQQTNQGKIISVTPYPQAEFILKHTLGLDASEMIAGGGSGSGTIFWVESNGTQSLVIGTKVNSDASLSKRSKDQVYQNTVPERLYLKQNFPNPFNPTTSIEYGLDIDAKVKVVVYDAVGREVHKLQDGEVKAGHYIVLFDAQNFSSGVYYYSLITSKQIITKPMLLLK